MQLAYVTDYPSLAGIYWLMRRCDFPLVPTDFPTAYAALAATRNYVVKRKGKVVVWVGYHNFTDESCEIDVCVTPELRRKWLTKAMAREIISKPLLTYGVKEVRIRTANDKLRADVLRYGFKQGYSGAGECVFTHNDYTKRFGV